MLDDLIDPERESRLTVRESAMREAGRCLEVVGGRQQRLEVLARLLLNEIDPDPTRAGLAETPRRVADMWIEFVEFEAGRTDTCFEHEADQMVMLGGLRIWSLCEHHLLPFYCDLAIAYIAAGKVIGLSKLARIAQQAAHRLNLQEGLVNAIAGEVERITGSPDVAVMAIGEHLCMTMRGARAPGLMLSTKLHGLFKADAATRAEFYQLAAMAGMAHAAPR
jgi:GTP cyclohydrolase I